jgi:hypothetical protein
MLRAICATAKAGVRDQLEMERLIGHLTSLGYLPVIRSIVGSVCGVLGLPDPEEDLVAKVFRSEGRRSRWVGRAEAGDIIGDVLVFEDTICIVSPHRGERLRAAVAGHAEQEEALGRFCEDIERAIRARFDGRRVRGMDFTWSTLSQRALFLEIRRYAAEVGDPYLGVAARQQAKFQSKQPEYGAEDVECCRLLVDDSARSFMVTLAKLGKMTSKDVSEEADPELVGHLLSVGLVAQEYLLTCKQDQHTICVVASRDDVKTEPAASARCSLCGRTFPEENLQEIYALTPRARRLLDGSLWMHVWVTELLVENGVRKEAVSWGLESQGDELDVMVEDFDSRAFFELKDREFGLGDAYPFVYRLTRYGGLVGIIATMDKVSSDARLFFDEDVQRRDFPSEIRYLEGAAEVQDGIAALVREMSLWQVRRLVGPFFSDRLGFDLWPLIEPRIASGTGQASPASSTSAG